MSDTTIPSIDQLNPYATYLGSTDPYEIIDTSPVKLAELVRGVEDEALTRAPRPGKWSIRDIVCHLADSDLVFGFRLRQTVAEAHHTIQPFDQDAWAAYSRHVSTRDAVDAFTAVRRWNLLFVRAVTPAALSKPVTHPERGLMTFKHIIETMAGHDVNHLRQIEDIRARG